MANVHGDSIVIEDRLQVMVVVITGNRECTWCSIMLDGIDSLMIEDRLLEMVVDITGDGECTCS